MAFRVLGLLEPPAKLYQRLICHKLNFCSTSHHISLVHVAETCPWKQRMYSTALSFQILCQVSVWIRPDFYWETQNVKIYRQSVFGQYSVWERLCVRERERIIGCLPVTSLVRYVCIVIGLYGICDFYNRFIHANYASLKVQLCPFPSRDRGF